MMTPSTPSPRKDEPLVPSSFLGLDVPTQRWYALSLGVLLQTLKISDVVLPNPTSTVSGMGFKSASYFFFKWNIVDVAYIFCLPRLRLPRLAFAWQASMLQFLLMFGINFMLFGPWTMQSLIHVPGVRDWYQDLETTLQGKTVHVQQMINSAGHLQGQHTVILSPINTVQINPFGDAFCLDKSNPTVSIPILFNNTIPKVIQYRHTSIDMSKSKIVELATHHLDTLASLRYDESDEEVEHPSLAVTHMLGKTETLRALKITKPGVVSLEAAGDARIRAADVHIVDCPSANFDQPSVHDAVRCDGEIEQLSIKIRGTPPLTLEYYSEVKGQRKQHLLEGIASELQGTNQHYEDAMNLTVKFTNLGTHVYGLERITDSLRNTVALEDSIRLSVVRRSTYSFRECGPGHVIPLLVGQGSTVDLRIVSGDSDARDGPWLITVAAADGTTHNVTVSEHQKAASLQVSSPGTYQITAAQGSICDGIVLNPSACTVVEQPLPHANITWSRIHECSSDIGVTASLMLHGKPPFRVAYSTKHNSHRPQITEKVFTGSRGEIVLQPEISGHYQYSFVKISDSNYKDIPIEGAEQVEQTVRPLASAQFTQRSTPGRDGLQVNSCEGTTVDVDLEFKGTPPWNVELQVVSPGGSSTVSQSNLTHSRETATIPIPSEINRSGGAFQIDLVSVQDAQGCKRQLVVPGLSVNVRRIKPLAKFYTGYEGRKVTILEGETADLPLRLSGEGPWTIKYSHNNRQGPLKSIKVLSPNDVLKVRDAGLYTIHEVNDSSCPGIVVPEESSYEVLVVTRPIARLRLSDSLTISQDEGGFIKNSVCEGTRDQVDLEFEGHAPFQIQYKISLGTGSGHITELNSLKLSSIHKTSRLELETTKTGRIFYDVEQIGDTLYPLHTSHKETNRGLRFRQDVLARPRAFFKTDKQMSFCLYESFASRDDTDGSGTVVLRGQPPFYLELSIRSLSSDELWKERVMISEFEWKISVPEFAFKSVGSYLVSLDSVKDESNCEEIQLSLEPRSLIVNVAETAAVVPYDARQTYCVGEQLRFQLEGVPPWQIKYVFNNQKHTVSTDNPLFHRIADESGEFSISSVAHQSDKCRTQISDVKYNIHAIPSARVSHGKRYLESIREGEQAEIVFELIGEPPFTFTYQRTEVGASKKGGMPSVLETKTISGVRSHKYSIYSSQEGTWTVTFIADKYCKYPSLSVESGTEAL